MFPSPFIATEQFQHLVNCIFCGDICFWLRKRPQNAVFVIDVVLLPWVPYFRREMLLKTVLSQTLGFQLPGVFMTAHTQQALRVCLFQAQTDKSKCVAVNYYPHLTGGYLLSLLPRLTVQVHIRAESQTQSSSFQCHHHSNSVLTRISVHGKVSICSITLLDFAIMDSVQHINYRGSSFNQGKSNIEAFAAFLQQYCYKTAREEKWIFCFKIIQMRPIWQSLIYTLTFPLWWMP